MKAVFEELNGEIAVFLVEELRRTVQLERSNLPADAQVGDVYEVEWQGDAPLQLLQKLPKERQRREEAARKKREELLRRNKKK